MRRKSVVLLCCLLQLVFVPLIAQKLSIKGVVGSNAEPLVGVTITIKDKNVGTISDMNGKWTLQAAPNDVLVFSYLGYKKKEVKVGTHPELNVTLEEDAKMLKEVISIGYRTGRKLNMSGSVASVTSEDIMAADENNPMKALQGKVAGMYVTSDGGLSGSAKVQIRGVSSYNSTSPLYIIDGIPTTQGMHELNPNDIDNIQVLKDASAASIYGSQAANGVIVVTTKQGQKGKVSVKFDSYFTSSDYQTKLPMLNTQEYAQVMWKAYMNSDMDPNGNNLGFVYDTQNDANGVPYMNGVTLPKYIDNRGNPQTGTKHTMLLSDTDWFDEITRPGFIQSYSLSVSNGTDRGNSFFSLSYYNNEGIIKETDFQRYSARINTSYKINRYIQMGENFTVSFTPSTGAPGDILNYSIQAVPMIPVRTEDGSGWGGQGDGMNDRHNPVRLIDANKDNRTEYWRMFGNAYLTVTPLHNLTIKSNFGMDYGLYYRRELLHSYESGYMSNSENSVTLKYRQTPKFTFTNTATYDIETDRYNLTTLIGVETVKQDQVYFNGSKKTFLVENEDYMWPSSATGTAGLSGTATGNGLISFFGNANFSWESKYLASVTLRRDGSSRFGENNQWGTFPAFSLGWRLSEENFLNKIKNISDIKLRFSWGQMGNQAASNYATRDTYIPSYGSTSYDINGTGNYEYTEGGGKLPSGYILNSSGNPNLKWETATMTNVGVDFSFFNQSLYGSLEYYIKKNDGLLMKPAYIGITGEGGATWKNGASMENKGMEFMLTYQRRTSCGLSYKIDANISGYRNEVTKLPKELVNSYGGNGKDVTIIGQPIGSYWGYVADGIFKTQEEVDAHANQEGKGVGRIRYKDLDGSGTVESGNQDQTWIGSPHPDFIYGITINLRYKGFDFQAFLQGVHNIDIKNEVKYHTDFWSLTNTGSNKGSRLLDAWSPQNPNSDIPSPLFIPVNDEGRFSSYFIENCSYLKMRNLQLGYTLPQKLTKKILIERLRFYGAARNVFTIKSKKFSGMDPENPNWGYPIPLNLTLGVNITF